MRLDQLGPVLAVRLGAHVLMLNGVDGYRIPPFRRVGQWKRRKPCAGLEQR